MLNINVKYKNNLNWTDVYVTHNIEHRTEPVSHYSFSGHLILQQHKWLSIILEF